MGELDFEIKGTPGEVSATTFKEAIYYAISLLREYDAAISGMQRGSLGWYIGGLHSNGTLLVSFRSKLKPVPRKKQRERIENIAPTVTANFLNGFVDIEEKCVTPPYLSEYGLQKVDDLAHLIKKNGANGFRFASASKSIDITERTSENLSKLIPIVRKAIGSVEGRLEGVNLHKRSRFIVYHAVTKRAVTCEFDQDRLMEEVRFSIGKRVSVFGTLHKNIIGDTLRVTVERLEVVDENKRFTIPSIAGLKDPDFTEAKTTKEYLRRVRGR